MAHNKRSASNWFPFKALREWWTQPAVKNNNKDQSLYLQDLIYQHRTFDVKGVAAPGETVLDLKHVFVDVGLAPTAKIVSAHPVPTLQKMSNEKRFSIWHFLLNQSDRNPQNLVVLGAPGSGKTTLLKYLALSLAAPTEDAPRLKKTPILLYLHDIAGQIERNPNYSLQAALQTLLRSRKVSASLDWIESELENGRCLIMLDGLDEVANLELRQQVAAWVQRQMQQHRHNQFIITSRPFGYDSNPLPNALLLQVKPFTIEQMHQFVTNWYLANQFHQVHNDEGGRREAILEAEDLTQRLHRTPALLEMSVNPLLLTMIATIHHFRGRLPEQRVALYDEICDVFLGRRQQAKGMEFELTPLQKKRVLQNLAFEMMRRNLRDIPHADAADIIAPALTKIHPQTDCLVFLAMIADTSGLLVEHKPGEYSFAHLTFQEYLAGVHIKGQHLEQILLNKVEDTWWHETIRLYSAQTDASNIIRACVMRQTASIPALTLAIECLDEALEVDDDFRKIPAELINSIEDDNPEIRRIGAEVLLQLRLRQLVRLDESTYADSSLVTQAEYQLFLDEMRGRGSYRQPDHWTDLQFAKGDSQLPIAGIRPSDAQAFCNWLTERDPGPWRYRLPTVQEKTRPPLNTPATSTNLSTEESVMGYWYFHDSKAQLAQSPELTQDVAMVRRLQEKIEQKLLNDWLFLPGSTEQDRTTHQLRQAILIRAKQRAFSLLDLERRLPFSKDQEAIIRRFFDLVKEREAEGVATDMEIALITAKANINNPNLASAREPILEEIIELGNNLLSQLVDGLFPEEISSLMRQLMRDLGRAKDQLISEQQSMQAEFLSYRELVRHINNALRSAQMLLDKLSRSRTDARLRLRINVLHRSLKLLQSHATSVERPSLSKREGAQLLNIFIDLYVDMAILESRTQNQLQPLEGIRIVREAAKI